MYKNLNENITLSKTWSMYGVSKQGVKAEQKTYFFSPFTSFMWESNKAKSHFLSFRRFFTLWEI
jgi:hypothetical protein